MASIMAHISVTFYHILKIDLVIEAKEKSDQTTERSQAVTLKSRKE